MTCKLCKKDRELKNSHIIPEFIYSALYDDKHRFHVISVNEDEKEKLPQKGVRERLLCAECEQLLSRNERYVSLLLAGSYPVKSRKKGRIIHLEGVDYSKFKLFSLSILWRAGVSSREVFSQVKLGPHEKILRQMVLASDPGEQHSYPFLLSPIVHEKELQKALIVQPTWTRLDNHYAYRFVFGGLAWIYLVSSHRAPKVVLDASIDELGNLTMIECELSDMKFIVHMVQELVKLGKL